jgi:hypothetical protein
MNFKLWEFEWPVTFNTYNNWRIAFRWTSNDWEPLAILTVNLVDSIVDYDEVIIDTNNLNWSIEEELINQWFITELVGMEVSWYCTYPKYKVSREVCLTQRIWI